MGEAVLAIWTGEGVSEVEVSWEGSDPDAGAKVKVPTRMKAAWTEGLRQVRRTARAAGSVRPYPTLPVAVTADNAATSASGAYAVAAEVWGERAVGWRVPPSYTLPDPDDEPEGVRQ